MSSYFASGKEYSMNYVYKTQKDGLGYDYLYNEMLHPVKNTLHGDFNGIINTTKPIHITITPYSAPV